MAAASRDRQARDDQRVGDFRAQLDETLREAHAAHQRFAHRNEPRPPHAAASSFFDARIQTLGSEAASLRQQFVSSQPMAGGGTQSHAAATDGSPGRLGLASPGQPPPGQQEGQQEAEHDGADGGWQQPKPKRRPRRPQLEEHVTLVYTHTRTHAHAHAHAHTIYTTQSAL